MPNGRESRGAETFDDLMKLARMLRGAEPWIRDEFFKLAHRLSVSPFLANHDTFCAAAIGV